MICHSCADPIVQGRRVDGRAGVFCAPCAKELETGEIPAAAGPRNALQRGRVNKTTRADGLIDGFEMLMGEDGA